MQQLRSSARCLMWIESDTRVEPDRPRTSAARLRESQCIEPNTGFDDRLKRLGAVKHAFIFREDNYREPGLGKRPPP